ncbi:hypothetical protein GEMRC1_003980 [Eukaryota sp. GEM-RC1]
MILLLLGQAASLLTSFTDALSKLLVLRGFRSVAFQLLIGYFSILTTSLPFYLKLPGRVNKWRLCLLYSVLDVSATYCVVFGIRYTSVASVKLLSCMTLMVCILLSYLFFKVVLSCRHYVGIFIALLGVLFLILNEQESSVAPRPLLGDFLVLTGAALYGVCNVFQEYYIKEAPIVEFCFSVGCCGSLVTFIIVITTELGSLRTFHFSPVALVFFALYGITIACSYVLIPFVVSKKGATF